MALQVELIPTGEIIRVVHPHRPCKLALGSDGVRVTMESALTARDRVGVQDFVLLENFTSEAAFIENLRRRFRENLIYTYIGPVLVSVNPYRDLQIYSRQHMERYRGVSFYEVPPHLFAVADTVYRALRTERRDQAVMISGESGAGKTEATKRLLQFYAETCPAPERGGAVRDRLLQSNPVLEAFGNAKTLRNDNSSRFGKYMDVQFDFKGAPVGGHILSYLLEKSRVVHQNHGERNFHIFYQLLEGGEEETLRRLGLERNPQSYLYLVKGQCAKVSSINDKSDWKVVRKALTVIDFTEDEVEDLLSIVASVLHLGNTHFAADEESNAQVTTENQLKYLTRLLGVEGSTLREALTHRKIIAKGEELLSPLNLEQAAYARDALAKAVYSRTFTWLVAKINRSLASKDAESPSWRSTTVLGLLDIYGFEVFQHNSFEQFCINYCNEKLQQLFIELTLKSEQEEYEAEGIAWEPVQYFNNKIICDLVEEKFKGIISILDEECLRPGEATDLTFLEKLEDTIKQHPHFLTHKLADQRTRKSLDRGEFRLLHYAGEVTYNVTGFLDKNNDLLFRNLKETMCSSENPILGQCFDRSELSDKKRPETVATQFKMSLLELVEILKSKEPAYVRCIKPNDSKQPGRFDEVLIRHQVKYLGLMENLRVRRAGFAYRRKYEAFLQRYKSLCPETWPTWTGRPQDGVTVLVRHLGYKPEEYKMGRTKIFIRFPKTLFATEDALEIRRQSLATKIQATWRGFHCRQKFLRVKRSAICIQSWWRGTLGRRKAAKRKWAAQTIRRLIQGFILRHAPRCPENAFFVDHVRTSFLLNLRRQLPRNILDTSWPTPPPALREASELLRELCRKNMVWKYCRSISPEWKQQLQQKAVASEIFKGKKDNYPQSVPRLFISTRLGADEINPRVLQALGSEPIQYAVPVVKYDRKGYKPRSRQLLLTPNAVVIVEDAKVKQRIEYTNLTGISVSSLSDSLFVLHVQREDNKQKGDVVLQSDHVIETLTKTALSADRVNNININQGSITFAGGPGRDGIIDFTPGSELLITKAKNGHLAVVAPRLNSR
ncbi:unconventional myosin-Ic isoform X1 [Bos indicus]|uniref:Unconventional myosin-Ic n=5 Tax=Bos TaxID=9903 RepID=MYO1C_BOVIN|nr:unconventional myosin-Ic [Bos taurus]XP_005888295.1 PREDICTED: unconventional myosin-Ic [Bos mutus]XP_019837206.1 PREDICTED: unconventional myosin-Ic isoform X1 [Bos indicus]XP_027373156.1 unconventional myosin-Ic isoform X1 [Bos indicus x Bos taurus]XP_045020856.1 unconventional myosin-Ic isoform X1 [Bubalus bubalis]XP_061246596.1 unconventional myosin-Ic isoform X1 [Bos javanicus]Q27966.3 RecName: Full=Unconventional myosin-Ic; AltName: Full=Myosin I beta; Short=MMI-beta; Short=MMIb [Bos